MNDLVISELTYNQLLAFINDPSQGLLLSGQDGIGKLAIADKIIEEIACLTTKKFFDNGEILGVDRIKEIKEFLSTKYPKTTKINRVVVIENIDKYSLEASNAFLKILEEPPKGTSFILTTENKTKVLKTILSRVSVITIAKPIKKQLIDFFRNSISDIKELDRVILICDGLPGKISQYIKDVTIGINTINSDLSKEFLAATNYKRLLIIDKIYSNKDECNELINTIIKISKYRLLKDDNAFNWLKIFKASDKALNNLQDNGQTRLIMMNWVNDLVV